MKRTTIKDRMGIVAGTVIAIAGCCVFIAAILACVATAVVLGVK